MFEQYGRIGYPVIAWIIYQGVKQCKERGILAGNNLFYLALTAGVVLCVPYEIALHGLSLMSVLIGITTGLGIGLADSGFHERMKPGNEGE